MTSESQQEKEVRIEDIKPDRAVRTELRIEFPTEKSVRVEVRVENVSTDRSVRME